MKKLLFLVLTLTLSFTVVACGNGDDPENGENGERSNPVISGVEDTSIYLNEDFDPMQGITAEDHDGEDLTDEITINGEVDVTRTGVTYLRYRVEDSYGNFTEAARYITVEVNPDDLGDEMVPNGDFSLDFSFWSTTTGLEGGSGDFNVVDEELKIDIHSTSGGMWEPRLENIGITFEQGTIYELSFRARAEEPRAIHVQVGEILDGAPWFLNFKPAVPGIVDLTTEMETYSLTFMMDEETNTNGAVIFEFGNVSSPAGNDNLQTTVYLDDVVVNEIDPDDYVDEIPPVIEGAGNTTITIGDTFDPLEGVSVFDNVDGEIDLTMDHVEGEVDVNELGEYTLTYTVSDEAGNETVVERVITVSEPQETEAGADYGWRMFLNDWDGTSGNMDVVDGELVLSVDNANIWENWQVQIIQDALALGEGEEDVGTIDLEAGKTYRISFDARATLEGEGTVLFGHSQDGWTGYFSETFDVTEEMQTFTFEFTLDADGDYDIESMFKFELGNLFAGIEEVQSFIVDNIVLEKQVDDAFEPTDKIVNGTFETGDEMIDYTYGWRPFVNDWEGSAGELNVVDGELVFDIGAINTWENWQLQIIQDNFAMNGDIDNEGSMDFVAGETYRVTFDARASVDGEAVLQIGHDEGDEWTSYFNEAFDVTDAMQTFTFEFDLEDSEMDYDTLAQFKIEMGLLFSGEEAPQSFTLDNVMIERLEGDDYLETELVVNGDFSGVALELNRTYGWRSFLNDWDGTAGELNVVDEQLVFNLSNINTWEAWQLQIIQDNFALDGETDNEGSLLFDADKSYRIRFDAKSSVDGEATLQIGHEIDGWLAYVSETFDVTDEMQTFTFEFDLDDSDIDYSDLAQLKFELGTLFSGEDAPQSFTLDNVIIEVLEDDAYENAGLIVNGRFEGVWFEQDQTLEMLPTPFGIDVQTEQVVWGAIEEADGFLVYIDGLDASPYLVSEGYAFNLEALDLDDGTYDIQIQALGDDENYLDSELSEVHEYTVSSEIPDEPTQLDAPFGIVINDEDMLQWGYQSGVESHNVYIDGESDSPWNVAEGNAFDLSGLTLDSGTYSIQIGALGDDVFYSDSELSDPIEYIVE